MCPRCGGFIPNNERPGEYPGAISRLDNRTEICSPCGEDEAIRDFVKEPPIPPDEWPVNRDD